MNKNTDSVLDAVAWDMFCALHRGCSDDALNHLWETPGWRQWWRSLAAEAVESLRRHAVELGDDE